MNFMYLYSIFPILCAIIALIDAGMKLWAHNPHWWAALVAIPLFMAAGWFYWRKGSEWK